jgi:hypothetical protein
VSVWLPSLPGAGVKVTEHDPEAPLFAESVQAAPPESDPLPPEKSTAPPGLPAEPESVSLTVAVHVVGPFTATEEGEHVNEVDVDLGDTEIGNPVVSAESAKLPVAA